MNAVFALMVPKLGGNWNFDDGMFVVAAMMPMGAGLQEPVLIWRPFVSGSLVVSQKLIKLLVDVKDAT